MALNIAQKTKLAPKSAQPRKLIDDLDEIAAARVPVAKPAESKTAVADAKTRADWVRNDPADFRAKNPAPAKPTGPQRGQIPPTRGQSKDPLDDVADARMAAEQDIDAANARATLEQRARSGLMGGGLSGASSAAEGDLARQQGRSKTLALQEFDRQAKADDFTDIQREAAIMDLEDAYDTDINGDGTVNGRPIGSSGVGDGNPENDIGEAAGGADAEREALSAANEALGSADYSWWDADSQPGSAEEPFEYAGTKVGLEARIAESAPGALPLTKLVVSRGAGAGEITIWVDQYGNHYTLIDDGNAPSRRERAAAGA